MIILIKKIVCLIFRAINLILTSDFKINKNKKKDKLIN